MEKVTRTYSFKFYDKRFFELSKEAGRVYSAALNTFYDVLNKEGNWLSKFELQKRMKNVIERENLHSDSFLASMQQFHNNISSWKEAKKKRPELKMPHKKKFLQPIFFKKSQIKYKDGNLVLTLSKNKDYVYIKWNPKNPVPVFGSVTYSKTRGWKMNFILEFDVKEFKLNKNKYLSIDLGVKRVATLFDGERIITLSGKKLKGLTHYRNKINALTQNKLSKKKKNSNRYKKLKRSNRKKIDRILNKQNDVLHKQSRLIVDYAIQNKIGNIIIGDCASIHDNTNCGTKQNQQIQQNPEQRLKYFIDYKYSSVSGQIQIVPEPYTSRTCPCCNKITKPKNRVFKCSNKECDFIYDRDGVGAINIYNQNNNKASFIEYKRIRLLSRPFGIRFKDNLSLNNIQSLLALKSEKPSFH